MPARRVADCVLSIFSLLQLRAHVVEFSTADALQCIEVHPPTHTVTATAKRTHTSYKTVCATRTVSVVGTVTTKQAFTSTISTASVSSPPQASWFD